MRKLQIIVLLVIIAAAIGIVFFAYFEIREKSATSLRSLGIKASGLQNFVIKEKFVLERSAYNEENVTAEKEGEILKIKIVHGLTKEKAEEYKNNQTALFEGLFNPQLPPYPEFLTNKTECAQEFLPIKKTTSFGDYYLVYANERFGYGICAQDLVKYKAGFGMFYCENSKNLFKIQHFINDIKIKDFKIIEDFFGSFQCEK